MVVTYIYGSRNGYLFTSYPVMRTHRLEGHFGYLRSCSTNSNPTAGEVLSNTNMGIWYVFATIATADNGCVSCKEPSVVKFTCQELSIYNAVLC
jgi:hypothetical protein